MFYIEAKRLPFVGSELFQRVKRARQTPSQGLLNMLSKSSNLPDVEDYLPGKVVSLTVDFSLHLLPERRQLPAEILSEDIYLEIKSAPPNTHSILQLFAIV